MSLNFVKSQRNNDMLVLNGYLYYKMSERKSKVLWRCVYYKNWNCRCSCLTSTKYSSGIIRRVLFVFRLAFDIKREKLTFIIIGILGEVFREPRHNHSPNHDEIIAKRDLRAILKYRRLTGTNLNCPIESRNIFIPGPCKVTNKNELFLLYGGNGKTDDTILIFSTRSNLNMLNESSIWICTWVDHLSVPTDFSQLYTIHCHVGTDVFPLVYVLMTDRRNYTYKCMLRHLVELQPTLDPKLIHTYFDRAFTTEFKRIFPNIEMKGNFSHLCKCVWEKLQTSGLNKKYTKDHTFAEQVKYLCTLSFVPVNDVVTVYGKLIASKYYVDNLETFRRILSYFEHTWVGYLAYGRRKHPVFPIKMWNSYEMIANEEPNAVTSIKGWNRKLNLSLGNNYNRIADFVEFMKSEQDSLKTSLEQRPILVDRTSPFTKNNSVYLDKDICLKVIVDNYDFGDTLLYLKYLSQTFDFYWWNVDRPL